MYSIQDKRDKRCIAIFLRFHHQVDKSETHQFANTNPYVSLHVLCTIF
jgi:hypothetical protein